MDLTADLVAPVEPSQLFAWVCDLARYPAWLSIVPRAVSDEPAEGDAGPAWSIDLRGRVGPLARSKRLRMVRTSLIEPSEVVFERAERDGQRHATWRLQATVAPVEGGSSLLTMHLHYAGRLWEPLVERLLRDEIEASRQRLLALVR
jgi:hypothetical protein